MCGIGWHTCCVGVCVIGVVGIVVRGSCSVVCGVVVVIVVVVAEVANLMLRSCTRLNN